MVCRGASKSRFRALKHENGIAGRKTIIVRVIACFRTLQNCQAEYFRQLLKPVTVRLHKLKTYLQNYITIILVPVFGPMVTNRDSHKHHQFSALTSTDLDHMMRLRVDQNYDWGGPDTAQSSPADGLLLKLLPPYKNNLFSTENRFLKCSHCDVPCEPEDKLIDPSCGCKRRFLIFDRSDNNTRLFLSHQILPQDDITPSKASCEKATTTRVNQRRLIINPSHEEKWDENHLFDEQGEMHEDTEEINALLYSDSDDEYDDDDDEVTSMWRTPFDVEEDYNKEKKSIEEVAKEASSCDGYSKRQRLLNGKYAKSPLNRSEIPMNNWDLESTCAGANELISTKQEKKVKVHEALKILETIIPGSSSSKDPLSIIDNAIVYLKSLKTEAETLGLGYLEPPTC